MFYQMYELNHAALQPYRALADAVKLFYSHPLNPASQTSFGRSVAGAAELFERTTRRYAKPEFGISETTVNFVRVPVKEKTVWSKPFCNLIHFERRLPEGHKPDPKILIVAPMSGHYATLLRGTVETFLPRAEVFITDWTDARMVPLSAGPFDLDDYVDYVIDMLRWLGPDTHVIAVCQPSVPVLSAVSVMEARGDDAAPSTMTLMGGPIDTRRNPTAVNLLAEEKGTDWFRDNVITTVPWPHPGFGRPVYPGFLQLSGFMSMNLDRHLIAHKDFFMHLVKDDGDSAEKHREFYDEYLAVMDMPAEFYLSTVERVFKNREIAKNEFVVNGHKVDIGKITSVAVKTVEGSKDDISAPGQCVAALDLCTGLPASKKASHLEPGAGHYGIFAGKSWRNNIRPLVLDFIDANSAAPKQAESKVVNL